MINRWIRYLLWRPFELSCRRYPLVPLRAKVTEPVDGVVCIRIDNAITRLLSRFSGGYDYAVCYLVDGSLLIDTGFPWARRSLRRTLLDRGADRTLRFVVNTHYHEDHTGNNDLLSEITDAEILAHRLAVPEIRFPPELPWYRSFLFGPARTVDVEPVGDSLDTERFHFEVHETPGHCPGHICLFEPERGWLFSGDLYVAGDLDSQLADADGPTWISSLDKVIALKVPWASKRHFGSGALQSGSPVHSGSRAVCHRITAPLRRSPALVPSTVPGGTMTGMCAPRGRSAAFALTALGVTLLAAVAFAFRGRFVEAWYLAVLEDDDAPTRQKAARVLGRMRSEAAIPALMEIVRHDGAVRSNDLALSVHTIPRREGAFALERLRTDYWKTYWPGQTLAQIGAAAVPSLVEALSDPDRFVYAVAAYVLSETGRDALPALREMLLSTAVPPVVKVRALYVIERMTPRHTEDAVPALCQLVTSTAGTVRDQGLDELCEHTVFVLGEIGETRADASQAIPALEVLRDSDGVSPNLRYAAEYALEKIGDG